MDAKTLTTCESPMISGAASPSDSEWKRRLPPSYADILAEVQSAPANWSSKEIYDFLCNGVLLRNGTQRFWLDRDTGGICLGIGARGLSITFGNRPSYWNWGRRRGGSWFSEMAYLVRVCWLEVNGTLQCSLHPGTYTLSWRLSYQSPDYIDPLKFSLKVNGNEPVHTQFKLTDSGPMVSANGGQQALAWRPDTSGWLEVDVGQFFVESTDSPVEVNFSMRETENSNWKSGLYLDGVVLRPSYLSGMNHRDSFGISPSTLAGMNHRDSFVICPPCLSPKYPVACRVEECSVDDDDDSRGPKSGQGADDGTSKLGIDGSDGGWAVQGGEDGTSTKLGAPLGAIHGPPALPQGDDADYQLEQARGENDSLKRTYARLEIAMEASRRTYAQLNDEHRITLAKVDRFLKEKAALEAEKVRLQEQVAKAEADARDMNMAVVGVKAESERLTTKVVGLERKIAQFEESHASHENETMKLSKEIVECKAILAYQDGAYKSIISDRNARVETLVRELSILEAQAVLEYVNLKANVLANPQVAE